MELWELVAKESIRDLVARYNANGDTGRFDQVVALFAPDAVMEIEDRTYRGPEEIRTIFTGAASTTPEGEVPARIQHSTTTLQIDLISETEATGRCYFQVIDDAGLDHWGRYLDRYALVSGHWRFWRRRVVTDGWVPGGWCDRVMRQRT